jgi:hypothetical protein
MRQSNFASQQLRMDKQEPREVEEATQATAHPRFQVRVIF